MPPSARAKGVRLASPNPGLNTLPGAQVADLRDPFDNSLSQ